MRADTLDYARASSFRAFYVGLDCMYCARYGADISMRSRAGRKYENGGEPSEIVDPEPYDRA